MIDVTRRYPQQIYSDAFKNWQYYPEARHKGYEVEGLLAAYLADKYLLDQGEDGCGDYSKCIGIALNTFLSYVPSSKDEATFANKLLIKIDC